MKISQISVVGLREEEEREREREQNSTGQNKAAEKYVGARAITSGLESQAQKVGSASPGAELPIHS